MKRCFYTIMFSYITVAMAQGGASQNQSIPIICDAVKNYDQNNYITNVEDRLFTKAEFNYYWGISDEDRRYLDELQLMIKKYGINIIALPIPYQAALYINDRNNPAPDKYNPKQAISNYRAQVKNLNDHGFIAIDLQEIAFKMPQGVDFFAKRDHHWTGDGMEKVADNVKLVVDKLNLGFDRTSVTTLTRKMTDYPGALAEDLARSCGYTFPIPEKRVFYDLSIKSKESLLGETNNDVVLLGDSYSTSYFGFDKILSDRLKTPVTSVGINGGGCCASINGFFAEMRPNDAKPKLLIWTALMVLTNANESRELKPSIYQAYQENKPIKETVLLQSTATSFNINQKLDKNSRYYIKFKTSGPKVEEMRFKLNYGDQNEDITLYRKNEAQKSSYTSNFFYELKPGTDIISTISTSFTDKTDVTISLYKYN